jgi:hypothetical protein
VHTVADLYCASCQTILGWKYLKTPDSDTRFKEGERRFERELIVGRFILEAAKIVKENNW